jgi:hypothetical protein
VIFEQSDAVAFEGDGFLQLEYELGNAGRAVRRGAADPDRVARLPRPLEQCQLAALEAAVEAIDDVLEPGQDRGAAFDVPAERRRGRDVVDRVLREEGLDQRPVVARVGLLEGGRVGGEARDVRQRLSRARAPKIPRFGALESRVRPFN